MNDGMYLEAMNQLRDINNARDLENKKYKEELLQLKKEMITAYGVVRVLDYLYDNTQVNGVVEIKIIIETLREYLSQFCEENIL